jgi:hypothetical protein
LQGEYDGIDQIDPIYNCFERDHVGKIGRDIYLLVALAMWALLPLSVANRGILSGEYLCEWGIVRYTILNLCTELLFSYVIGKLPGFFDPLPPGSIFIWAKMAQSL